MKGTPDQVGADQSFGGVREIGGRSCSKLFGSDIESERGEPESGYPEQYDSSDRSDSVEDCQSDNNDEISQDSTGDGSEVDASSENSQFETAWTCSLQTPFKSLDNIAPSHEYIRRTFCDVFLSKAPPQLVHMSIVYKTDPTDDDLTVEMHLRVYIQCKRTSSATWSTWFASDRISNAFEDVEWTAISGGLASHPAYLRDMKSVADAANPWKILLTIGKRAPELR